MSIAIEVRKKNLNRAAHGTAGVIYLGLEGAVAFSNKDRNRGLIGRHRTPWRARYHRIPGYYAEIVIRVEVRRCNCHGPGSCSRSAYTYRLILGQNSQQ